MKAIVFHDIGDIRLDDVPEPKVQDPTDAIVRLTASAICGTDLHMVRGTLPGMKPGTILGHEGVGTVEEIGKQVRNLKVGDRVVIPSTIGCGACVYCRSGYYAQCDNANPNGKLAGTAFFGGPESSGPFHGLQAQYARIPFAHVGPVKLPEAVSDDQAILISDIFTTGYFGADLANIKPGDIVVVLGCGPVGQFAIASAKLMGAGRVLAVDKIPSRLDMARAQGAEIINFDEEDPVEAIRELTLGIGADRVIDAVGVDAEHPHDLDKDKAHQHAQDLKQVAPQLAKDWQRPEPAPVQALSWAVQTLAKAGTLSIIGVYPPTQQSFPIGMAMNKNLTLNMGNCNHRKYIPRLVGLVQEDAFNPESILTQTQPLTSALDAYKTFDERQAGWMKVELTPGQ